MLETSLAPMRNKTPFPRIAVALGLADSAQLLAHARREAEAGENFLEFRLDYLEDPSGGIDSIRQFLSDQPQCLVLATCRRHQNRGLFNGSVEEQLGILGAAIRAGAQAVDVEIESAEKFPARVDALRSDARLVVSYHNFEGTPQVEPVLRRLLRVPADAYKIVTTARKHFDSLRVLNLAHSHPRLPLILLAMGEIGFPTRVLSLARGGLYTYAAPLAAEGTAAGQVQSWQLRHLYHVEKLSKSSKIYGVIADPVRHSISPAVHNRAFQARRYDAVYLPFRVAPLDLRDFLCFATGPPLAGFSVTIPHKQRVIRHLDAVELLARRIGAVNTVWRKAGKWRGTNTDVQGVLAPLARRLRLGKASVLIAGNGGAARGAACALADAGARVFLTGRNPDRVRALAKICGGIPTLRKQVESEHFDALVHATPLGMFPHVNECFFEDSIPAEVVCDTAWQDETSSQLLLDFLHCAPQVAA